MSSIFEVDKDFKVELNLDSDDVQFYNIKENPWCLYGLLFDDMFRRMPKEVAEKVNEGVSSLHTNTSGGRLRFITDSPYIALVAKMPDKYHFPHMPQTGVTGFDLYVDKRYYSTFIPPIEMENILSNVRLFDTSEERNIKINFPLYNNVSDLYIGLKKGSCFKKALDYETKEKIVYYGSSITQGGCVSRPGLAYTAIISNDIGCDFVNLGFSSSAMGEEIMAEYIGGLDPTIFVMDYDHNAPTPEHLRNTHEKFFKVFRKLCPKSSVVFVSAPNFNFPSTYWAERRDIVKTTYKNALANGDKNVYFVDGERLWGNEHWDLCTMDRTHPNDLGHFKMAQEIIPTIKNIIHR